MLNIVKKYGFLSIAAVLLIATAFAGFGAADDSGTTYFQGKGTYDNPYLINDVNDLKMLSDRVNGGLSNYSNQYFRLLKDIDLSSIASWVPIGTESHPFCGSFDGHGNTITGMTVNANLYPQAGLFGAVKIPASGSATFTKIGVEGTITYDASTAVSRNVTRSIGGLIGAIIDSESSATLTIDSCYANVNIDVTGTPAKATAARGLLDGNTIVGGLIGCAFVQSPSTLNVTNIYTNGEIVSTIDTMTNQTPVALGGVLGGAILNNASTIKLDSWYSTATVIADQKNESFVGGLIGYVTMPNTAHIYNSQINITDMFSLAETVQVSPKVEISEYHGKLGSNTSVGSIIGGVNFAMAGVGLKEGKVKLDKLYQWDGQNTSFLPGGLVLNESSYPTGGYLPVGRLTETVTQLGGSFAALKDYEKTGLATSADIWGNVAVFRVFDEFSKNWKLDSSNSKYLLPTFTWQESTSADAFYLRTASVEYQIYMDGVRVNGVNGASSFELSVPNATYYLSSDIALMGSLTVRAGTKGVTIDLGGFTLGAPGSVGSGGLKSPTAYPALIVEKDAEVIILTSDVASKGKIQGVGASGVSGIVNNGGTVTLALGNITGFAKSGYYQENGLLTMAGGEFVNNSAENGGAIYIKNGSAVLIDGTIRDNSAENGGAVYMNSATGALFLGNPNDFGVDVGRDLFAGTLNMSGNKATGNGGAVYVEKGIFGMVDGSISGNTAGDDGDGVYLNSTCSSAYFGGGSVSTSTSNKHAVYNNNLSFIGMALSPVINGGKGLYLGTGKITNVTVTVPISFKESRFLTGAYVLIDDADLGDHAFTYCWNSSANKDPASIFKALSSTNKVAALRGNEVAFVGGSDSSTGYALVTGTVVNITGDRIGYAGVPNSSIDLYNGRYSGLTFGYTNDVNDNLVLSVPGAGSKVRFEIGLNTSSNKQTISIDVVDYAFKHGSGAGEGNVTQDKVWKNSTSGQPVIGEYLTMVYNLSQNVKYAGIPTISNIGGLQFTPDASNITVTNESAPSNVNVDHSSGIEYDGRPEIIITDPSGDSSQYYKYTFTGKQLGDVNRDGLITSADYELISKYILENGSSETWSLDSEQLMYSDIKTSAGNGKVTLADYRALYEYVNGGQ